MKLSLFFIVFSWILGGLILFYSAWFMKGKRRKLEYFLYTFLTLVCATGAFMADNFMHFLVFWGSLLVLLYAILSLGSFKTASSALTIVGIGDFCLILGVSFLIVITKGFSMSGFSPVPTDTFFNSFVFLLIAFGAMAKAGVFGFHNWIIDAAETNSSVTLAFLPASLDKFLGIYLFVRVCRDFFIVSPVLTVILMAIGAFTILAAVLLALVQHDLKKLLAYHAVSQVGYMVLGIASGTILGLVGGLFHMVNNTIYKSCLFLSAANIKHRLGKTELSCLGGLDKLMPVTFGCTLIASLSISGIPPFNGFVSKWLIYQGLIPESISIVSVFKIVFLVIAMFGSALTLASFAKLLYSAFLSKRPKEISKSVKEVPFMMQLPIIIMSILCVLFGVFAERLIIKPFFSPIFNSPIVFTGVWKPGLATLLIFIGIIIGVVIYLVGKISFRTTDMFIGGEKIEDSRISGTDFYLTVKGTQPVKFFYWLEEKGCFDFHKQVVGVMKFLANIFYYGIDRLINLITNGLGKLVFAVSGGFKRFHTGLLDHYVAWILLGLVIILGVLFRCLNCI